MLLLRNIIFLCAFFFAVHVEGSSTDDTTTILPTATGPITTTPVGGTTTMITTTPVGGTTTMITTTPVGSTTTMTTTTTTSTTTITTTPVGSTTTMTTTPVGSTTTMTTRPVGSTTTSITTTISPIIDDSTAEAVTFETTEDIGQSNTTTLIPPTESDEDSSNLGLILGLSLGIGIPLLIVMIGLIYYFVVYKPKSARVKPVNSSSNDTVGAVTEIPLKPTKGTNKQASPPTNEF